MQTIGFIGLGLMGSRMARRLLATGHRMVVHNRTATKANELLDAGADWAGSPAEAAKCADVVWTMLSSPEIVEAAAVGTNGFLRAMKRGAIWIDSSTIGPICSRGMADAAGASGVRFLDAPVSGSTQAAENGELVFLVGGDGDDIVAARPLFDALGRKVLHAGRHGQGSALKLVFNQILGTALLGAAEALMLGDALDIDRDTLLEALEDCAALAPSLRSRMRASLSDAAHEPGFPLRWAEKDLRLATQTAAVEDTVLPLADVARSMYGLARVYGWGDKGITAVFEFLRGNRPATGEPSTSRQPSRPR